MTSKSAPPPAEQRLSHLRRALIAADETAIDEAASALGISKAERAAFTVKAQRVLARAQAQSPVVPDRECELALGVLAALAARASSEAEPQVESSDEGAFAGGRAMTPLSLEVEP